MCFSANASFGAGIILSVMGVASIKKVQSPSQLLFASIPLVFAIQQFSEGFLWLMLRDPNYYSLQRIITYIFLFFAQILWPMWVPISVLLLEKKNKRTSLQKIFVVIGMTLACYLAYCLLAYPVQAKIIGHHISYELDYPIVLGRYCGVLYVIATIVPPFFSSIKKMWMLGATILVSYIIATIWYENYFISIWCFFASIISISIFVIMKEIKNSYFIPLHH